MTAILSPPLIFQGVGFGGEPLPFGYLYSYIAGTSTPQATWTDSTQVQQNLNPVKLNVNGQAPVWLDPTLTYKFKLTDALGNQVYTTDQVQGSLTAASLASIFQALFLATITAGNIGSILYPQTAAEAAAGVTPTNYAYPQGDSRRYGADLTGVADSTTALQNLIKVCESDTQGAGTEARLIGGTYKITSALNFTKRYVRLRGDGWGVTSIVMNGVADNVFHLVAPVSGYWQPIISDFSVLADSTSLDCFDVSALSGGVQYMFQFEFRNLYTQQGGRGIFASNAFSGVFSNWNSWSYNNHSFAVACGPGISWISCYALSTGTAKAGFRLCGEIALYSCNGINAGDWWGVFGQDPTAADGFQNDFPTFSDDYPDITIINPNIEAFAQTTLTAYAITVHNVYKQFTITGGKVEHEGSANYGGIINCRLGAFNTGAPARLAFGLFFLGSGTAQGPAGGLTNAYLYMGQRTGIFEDSSGDLCQELDYDLLQ